MKTENQDTLKKAATVETRQCLVSTPCLAPAQCLAPAPPTIEGSFSYYVAPIRNVLPLRSMTLGEVYELVVTDFFETHTDKVRKGVCSKSDILPYITVSAVCKKRHISNVVSYSGIIGMDADDCDISLKCKIAADRILNPALIFVSPSGTGLKIFIQITNARQEDHLAYYNAIAHYLHVTYQLPIDKSGSDIPRACYLCRDTEAFYSAGGSIDSADLLSILPPVPVETRQCLVSTPDAPAAVRKNTASARNLPPAPPSASTGDRPSDKLNRLPEIHQMTVRAMERIGWQQISDDLWTRSGKDPKNGCSAKWNMYEKENLFIMTVFTSNGFPFKAHRAYTDVMILCLLDYNDDWTSCITDLASRFLEPV